MFQFRDDIRVEVSKLCEHHYVNNYQVKGKQFFAVQSKKAILSVIDDEVGFGIAEEISCEPVSLEVVEAAVDAIMARRESEVRDALDREYVRWAEGALNHGS